MKMHSQKKFIRTIAATLIGSSFFLSGVANATATDANVCDKMIVPAVNIGINGDPRHFSGYVLGYGSDIHVSCGIPNSSYLGSIATVEIYVTDNSGSQDLSCTLIARDLANDTDVGIDTVASSGTGVQTLTANVSTSGYNSRDLSYTVDCTIPEIYGANFISSINGFHLY